VHCAALLSCSLCFCSLSLWYTVAYKNVPPNFFLYFCYILYQPIL